jgi:GntR family transcriptional regulator/MocR family aminotransferase
MGARGTRGGPGPVIAVETIDGTPIYERIYRAFRDAIVRGDLPPGYRIASSRAIAVDLAVSRFTAVTALERLISEGYLTAQARGGTFVAAVLPDDSMRATTRAKTVATPPASLHVTPALSSRGRSLSAIVITGPRHDGGPLPFHPRRPALDVFPVRTWARLLARGWKNVSTGSLDYGDPAGYAPLRQAIAEHISVSRGVRCSAAQVIVTSGAQQAFDMLFRILIDPGDRVWMEDPGYLDVRAALVGAGATLVPVPMTAHGLDVDAGMARAPDARLAVVSPSHQYPTGATLAAPRRAALLDWARRAGAWIVEDDYDSYFRYRGRPLPALQRFDADSAHGAPERVIYVGTFSKTMFPALRLGFCIVPEALVDAATNARAVASRNPPRGDQAALAAFMTEGHYNRHLRRARLVYQERYEAMRAAFAREIGDLLTLRAAAAGTHVLAEFTGAGRARRRPALAQRVAAEAAAARLTVFPLSRYCLEPPAEDALVLGYGALTPRQIAAGAARLASVVRRTIRTR